jgi:hypothetical protein
MWWKKKKTSPERDLNERVKMSADAALNAGLFEWEDGELWQKEPAGWSPVIQELKKFAAEKKYINVYIPVTEDSFDKQAADPEIGIGYYMENYLKAGYIPARAQISGNIVEVFHCRPVSSFRHEDIWIEAWLDMDGKFIYPFTLDYSNSKEAATAKLLRELGLPLTDGQGKLNARYEPTTDESYFKVFIGDLCGMFCSGYLVASIKYKNVELFNIKSGEYSFELCCVQTPEDRYGLKLTSVKTPEYQQGIVFTDEKKVNIPAIYYSPFKKIGDKIVATTRQDGSAIRFEITKDISTGKWTVKEVE